ADRDGARGTGVRGAQPVPPQHGALPGPAEAVPGSRGPGGGTRKVPGGSGSKRKLIQGRPREVMGMHVVVCIKQVIDPEMPAKAFRIAADQKSVERGSASLVIGPFDLNAMEVAVQLKERHGAK